MTARAAALCLSVATLAVAISSDPCGAVSDCIYAGVTFSDGAVSCQSGHQFRCSNGSWEDLDLACSTPPPAPTVINPAGCVCTQNELADCASSGQVCCVSLEGGRCSKRCCPAR